MVAWLYLPETVPCHEDVVLRPHTK